MAGYKGLKGKETNKGKGFENNPENINRKGQPLSIKTRLKSLMKEGGKIRIPVDEVELIELEDGDVYEIQIPDFDAFVFRFLQLMLSSNDKVAFDALKHYWEQDDGKAKQSVEHSGEIVAPVAPTIIFNTKKK